MIDAKPPAGRRNSTGLTGACLTLLALLLGTGGALSAKAAVDVMDWSPDALPEIIVSAAKRETLILVIITGSGWCDGCTELDAAQLVGPQDTELSELARDWVVLRISADDPAGAAVLDAHELGYLDTPTTVLLEPLYGHTLLGVTRRLESILGYPDDYVQRLSKAAGEGGAHSLERAETAARASGNIDDLGHLARTYAEWGYPGAALSVYRSLLQRSELPVETQRTLRLAMIRNVYLRNTRNYQLALIELTKLARDLPDAITGQGFAQAQAWALLGLQREREALLSLNTAARQAANASEMVEVVDLSLRFPSEKALSVAEDLAQSGLARFADAGAELDAARARLLWRQGRHADAAAAFSAALEKGAPDRRRARLWQRQLEQVSATRARDESP